MKMDLENIMFYKKSGVKLYTMIDVYLNYNIYFGYKDSYNYDDIDVGKIILLKKSCNEYFVRYNDVDKEKIVPLQVKIESFYLCELHMCTSGNSLGPSESDDEKKRREIQDKIFELTDMYSYDDFVEISDYGAEFIMLEVEKGTSAIRDKNRNYLVFIFTSVINNIPQTSLVQYGY